jgi:leucyl aminopeptidase
MNRKVKIFIVLSLLLGMIACNMPLRSRIPLVSLQPGDVVPDILGRMQRDLWAEKVNQLSGGQIVQIDGQSVAVQSRYDYAMFLGMPNARGFDFIYQEVQRWIPLDQIEVDAYPYQDSEKLYIWKNLIVTLPGTTRADEFVILSAHMDSTVFRQGNPLEQAPGADDNGTGAALLLEATRLLKDYKFERTIKIIWFSGEEHNQHGSREYVKDHSLEGLVGVINMDMFGYDGDGDRCFEIHAGMLPESQKIATDVAAAVQAYNLNLKYDYLTSQATDRSDHIAFWEVGKPAILISENFIDHGLVEGCKGIDINPNYHLPSDTIDKLNLDYGFAIAKAGLAAAAQLALPVGLR